ncbi:MAG: amidohydrolase family protein [Chloroflexi bacterium]|nr:amidohydrolase family protein [Chloroflexota bacterium]
MKTIAVEEHFATQEYLDNLAAVITKKYPNREVVEAEKNLDIEVAWFPGVTPTGSPDYSAAVIGKLLDCGEGRIKVMDEEGIEVQVLSLISPGVQIFDPETGLRLARNVNDRLSQIVKEHPDRFVGLATIPPQAPAEAAAELERAVRQLGLRGASINSHTRGEYLDERKYWPILQKAAELGVPIYIHPRMPSPAMVQPYTAYPNMAGALLGFGAEVSLHALRLMYSGVFDEYPGLKILLGHLGEALPFWLWRIDNRLRRTRREYTAKKLPGDYFRENFYATTSGNFSFPAFLCTYLVSGADNILFAVDYPLESNAEAVHFLESLAISPGDKEKVSHLNAEKLFGL